MTTNREKQVLRLIAEDPMISQQAIAEKLGISRSGAAGHIMKLTNKGLIRGRGYVISDTPFVVVIGGANMDIHGRPAGAMRRNDSNPGTVHMSPGGVARNIAENLSRLGVDSRLISAVGNDSYGQMLIQHCRDAGIDVRSVQRIESAPTSTYLSVLDEHGEMHVGINDMAIIGQLGPAQLQNQKAMLKQASLIILDTNLRGDTLAWLTNNFAGQALFVDTVSTVKAKKIEPHLDAIHTLKTNRIEAEELTGLSTRTQADRQKLATWVHDRGVTRLFVTLGNDGVFFSTLEESGVEKANTGQQSMRNTGGAGDAFLAGVAYASLNHWSTSKSAKFALAAAAVTLSDDASSSSAMSLATVKRIYKSEYAR